jgi:ankyrin repeat protein
VNGEGLTPLMLAAANKRADVVSKLLQHEADVRAVDAQLMTALHFAVGFGSAETAAVLLQHGADVNAGDIRGITPLMAAAGGGSYDCSPNCMQLLISAGANLRVRCETDETVLLMAASRASKQCVQLLLDAGGNVSHVTAAGTTVLHAAALNTDSQVLQLVLQHTGAMTHINNTAKDCDCCGNLAPLAMCSQPAHVKLLLAAGADVRVTTSTGYTCLHVAAAHGYPASVVCLLIKAGVALQAVNSDGKTAAQVATDCSNTLIALLLARAAVGP